MSKRAYKAGTEKMSVWVWHCDAPHGGFLFRENPNQGGGIPPYHLGGIFNLVNGDELVWAETKAALEMESGVVEWNQLLPQFRVRPTSIMVEIRPYYKRASRKESK